MRSHTSATGITMRMALAGLSTWVRRISTNEAKLLRDFGPTVATRCLALVSGILTSVLTAKALGPVGRGEYFYFITLAGIVVQFGHLGLASNNTYAVVRDPQSMPRLAANSLWISLIVGGLSSICLLMYLAGMSHDSRAALALTLLTPCLLYSLLASNLLVGMGRVNIYNSFVFLSTALQLIVIFGLTLYNADVSAFLWVSATVSALSAGSLFLILRYYGARRWSFSLEIFMSGMHFAVRVYVATLFGFLVSRLGVIMVDRWCSPQELGYFSIAVQFTDALVVIPATASLLLFPELVRSNSTERLAQTLRAAALMTACMALLCLVVGAAVPWLIPALFGPSFNASVLILWCALPGVVAISALNIVSQYLAAIGFPVSTILAWIGCVPIQIVLGYWFIPMWGASGAAVALSVTYICLAIALFIIALRRSALYGIGEKK
jgi:enterobacterial common antigen flippase